MICISVCDKIEANKCKSTVLLYNNVLGRNIGGMEKNMRKTKKAPIIVSFVLIGLLMAVAIGLLFVQAASNGWVFETENVVKFGVLIIGLTLSLIKLIGRTGGVGSLRKYESLYSKHIGTAFSAPDQKKQKKSLLRAIADYNENKYDTAISRLASLRRECRSGGDRSAVLLILALTYSDSGMTDEAVATYEDLVEIDPCNSTAWSNLGLLYRQKGENEKAITCIENAIDSDRDNAYAWNNLAQAHLAAGNWEKVISPALRSLAIKSDMYQAETALTVAYFAMDEHEKSKQYFDRAVLHGANASKLTSILSGMAHGTVAFGNSEGVSETVSRAVGHLERDTAIPMVEVRLPAPNDGNRSRLGGAPVDSEVPTDGRGCPMKLLAAIWCSEVRGVPDFPSRGVLRFYVSDNDLYGADFDRPCVQSDFRVLFDENEEAFDPALRDDPCVSDSFPILHVLPVRMTPAMSSVRSSDYRFEQCVNEALIRSGFTEGDALSEREGEFIYERNAYAGHRIGGYPCFEQEDPRGYNEALRKYDTLLLQIVSHTVTDENGKQKDLIMFGDNGGCQFFIPRDRLIARDFSDVMYWWDCE